jgi:hypothetical protein
MESETISEKQAWEIVFDYAQDLISVDRAGLLAVYAIGSLGGGYYRPRQSDIDTIVIVKDDAAITQEEVDRVSEKYWRQYHIPKGFGSVVAAEKDLFPPYLKSEELEFEFAQEIVRLKLQGKAVYGSYDLSKVPLPAKNDLIHDALIMETWFDKEFGPEMFDQLEEVGCTNSILIYLRRYLMIEKNIFVLNKFSTVETYCTHAPPMVDEPVISIINNLLHGYETTENELGSLRRFGNELRRFMNRRILDRRS